LIKTLGLTLALVLTLAMAAAAEDVTGTIMSFDPAAQSFVLEDGTQLWLSTSQQPNVGAGDKVLVTYEVKDGKKVVVDVRATPPLGGAWTPTQEGD
jgi:uncharacterized protein DUF1344